MNENMIDNETQLGDHGVVPDARTISTPKKQLLLKSRVRFQLIPNVWKAATIVINRLIPVRSSSRRSLPPLLHCRFRDFEEARYFFSLGFWPLWCGIYVVKDE